MKIRPLDAHEAEGLLELWTVSTTASETDTVADIGRLLREAHARCLVADIDGQIVGSIIATFDGWRGNIYRLAVRPDHRRRGIARALVASVEEAFAEWGVRRVTVLVERDHSWAVGFWSAVGYELDARIARFVRNLPRGS
jgi:ribosomal protein S18 acetylase RimI-like enzyme